MEKEEFRAWQEQEPTRRVAALVDEHILSVQESREDMNPLGSITGEEFFQKALRLKISQEIWSDVYSFLTDEQAYEELEDEGQDGEGTDD